MFAGNPDQYVNRLFQETAGNSVGEIVHKIPPELGKMEIRESMTRQGISYIDWSMYWEQDMHVTKCRKENVDQVQMIFFLNRGMDWEVEGSSRVIDMKKGEMCIYRDRAEGSTGNYAGNKTFVFKSIQIPTKTLGRILGEYMEPEEERSVERLLQQFEKAEMTPRIQRILKETDEATEYKGGFSQLHLECKSMELLAAGLESFLGQEEQKRRRKIMAASDCRAVREIREYIDQNPALVPETAELARKAGMSISKLSQGFKELTGKPIHSYVIDQRLEYAAFLLTEGKVNVSQAAMLSGYTNMSHFSAAFKKKYGILPKNYRN